VDGIKFFFLAPPDIVPATDIIEVQLGPFQQIQKDAEQDAHRRHILCDYPEEADLILAPVCGDVFGPCFEVLRRSPFYSQYQGTVVIYAPDDLLHPALPGLYPGCRPLWHQLGWAVPAHYRTQCYPTLDFRHDGVNYRDLLYSFVGSVRNHPVRARLMELKHCQAYLFDSSPDKQWWDRPREEQRIFIERYREIILRSKFVLCPRGVAPSSVRLFETMEAGRVPVIIADGLLLPRGPTWSEFSLRVSEHALDKLPRLLEEREPDAAEMGQKARQAWEDYFSPWSSFNSLVNWAYSVQGIFRQRSYALWQALVDLAEFVQPRLVRKKLRFELTTGRLCHKARARRK